MNKRTKDLLAKCNIDTINDLMALYPKIRLEYWTFNTNEYVNKAKVICKCVCGVEKELYVYDIGKKSKSCGCMKSSLTKATNLDKYGVDNPSKLPCIKKKKEETCLSNYGTRNPMQSEEVKRKSTETNIERYGAAYSILNEEVKRKSISTMIERYGVESAMQNPEIKKKTKETIINKYGVEYLHQCPDFKRKAAETNVERYGEENAMQNPEIAERQKNAVYANYGVHNPSHSGVIQERKIETSIERYGVKHPHQNPEIRDKYIKTMIENDYSSVPELELKEWIESNFDVEVSKSYIGGSNPKEVDILIKKNDINILAIEYNGDYWHSEANKSIHKNYHKYKTEQVRLQKICQLIHVFDSEWQTKKDVVKGFLRSKLERGVTVRASKCEVREASWEDAKEFCNNYHLQGKPQHSKLSLGLYYRDELISLMTFSKPHRQNMGSEYHLSRYAIKHGYRVHGGLSKLSKHAYSKVGSFVTYVHLRLSSGESYLKTGYEKIGETGPDYWYWDTKNHKVISKQSRKKSIVNTPEGMTEKEHALNDKLYRIWDCGKIKLRYSKPSRKT